MYFKLSSLLIFFALWDVSRTIQIHSTRMLDTSYVTKSGNISINSDNNGYFLNVDVSDHYSDASDDENYDNDNTMTYMTMALYTSQTILINGTCLDFKTYNCSEFGCTPYTSNSSTPVLPYFQVTEGYYAKADVILDYNYWKLNTNATIAISCTIPHISYGNGRVGMLGLGQSSGSQANFLVDGSVFFSVYLDPSNRKSSLLFKSNTNITSISEKVGGLATNADWNVLPHSVGISVLNYTTTEVLGAIFDINVQEIGFPVSIYKEIMQALQSTGLLNCEEDVIYDPTCYFDYAPNNDAFPTIKLTFDTGDIELPPDLYMAITIPIRVYLKALDPSLSGVNYVTEQYKNYIVFGSSFLTYYYSEYYYNGETYFVDLYKPNFSNPATGSSDWPYIVGAALGFIIFVGVIVFLVKRRRNKRIRDQAQKKLDFNESSQALISSEKAPESVSIPSYQRDYTKYQYGQESWISPDVPQSS